MGSNILVAIFVSNGSEDIETIVPTDIWRRVGWEVDIISITGSKEIELSNKTKIVADKLLEEIDVSKYDAIYFPGGPGYQNFVRKFSKDGDFIKQISSEFIGNKDKYILAMCAAPDFLGRVDLIKGRNATCYPKFEKTFANTYKDVDCCIHENLITGRGPGASMFFAFDAISEITSESKAKRLASEMKFSYRNNDE